MSKSIFTFGRSFLPESLRKSVDRPSISQLNGGDAEDLLESLCTPVQYPGKDPHPRISSERCVEIASLLASLYHKGGHNKLAAWSVRPRTYAVLKLIGRLDILDAFAERGLTDLHIPFNEQTLPDLVDGEDARRAFLHCQNYVLSQDGRELEKPGGPHVSIAGSAQRYFYHKRDLGQGGFGAVDDVMSRLSLTSYARKRVARGKDSENARKAQSYLIQELDQLKALSHRHLVKHVASYTDERYIAFLMQPVADCDLKTFLHKMEGTPAGPSSVRHFYGCLAGAINYLHENGIRHRDLKSRNILVKDGMVFVADFGTAYNRKGAKRNTTNDRNVPQSVQYIAPEIAHNKPRNNSSDMWSLGIIFLEISTVLLGNKLANWKAHLETTSKKRRCDPYVWTNVSAAYQWMDILKNNGELHGQDNETLSWGRDLLQSKAASRLTSVDLMKQILECPSFNAFCCVDCWPDYEGRSFLYNEKIPQHYNRLEPMSSEGVQDQVNALFNMGLNEDVAEVKPEKQQTIEAWLHSVHHDNEEMLPSLYSSREEDTLESLGSYLNFDIVQDTSTTKLAPGPEHTVTPSLNGSDASFAKTVTIRPTHYKSEPEPEPEPKLEPELERQPDPKYEVPSREPTYDTTPYSQNIWETIAQQVHNEWTDSTAPSYQLPEESQGHIPSYTDTAQWSFHEPYESGSDTCVPVNNNDDMPLIVHNGSLELSKSEANNQIAQSLSNHNESRATSPPPSQLLEMLNGSEEGTVSKIQLVNTHAEKPSKTNDQSSNLVIDETQKIKKSKTSNKSSEYASSVSSERLPLAPIGHKYSKATKSDSQQSTSPNKSQVSTSKAKKPQKAISSTKGSECVSSYSLPSERPALADPNSSEINKRVKPKQRDSSRTDSANESQGTKQHNSHQAIEMGNSITLGNDPEPTPGARNIPSSSPTQSKGKKKRRDSLRAVAFANVGRKAMEGTNNPVSVFSPQVYMETAWESATTQVTKDVDFDKKTLSMWKWLDRDMLFLENYCKEGGVKAVRLLLEQGCNPGTTKKPRPNALLHAVMGQSYQHYKCVQELMKYNVNLNVSTRVTGKTPLQIAIEQPFFKGHTNLVRDLVAGGANTNTQDHKGKPPIISVFDGNESSGLGKHMLDALACLLRGDLHETNVDVSDPHTHNTPLHLAVRRKTPVAVGMLLYKKANVNAKNQTGATPLLLAAAQWNGRLDTDQEAILNLLLQVSGIELDEKTGFQNRTALHQAVIHAAPEAVNQLLKKGASTRVKDINIKTAEDLASILDDTKWKDEKSEILKHFSDLNVLDSIPR